MKFLLLSYKVPFVLFLLDMVFLVPEIKLNSSNYHMWKSHIIFIFKFRHLYEVVTNPKVEPDATTTAQEVQDKWKTQNKEALGLIGISMTPELHVHISKCTKAHEAWRHR